MTMIVRHTELTNTTGTAIVAGKAPVISGQDYACEALNVTLVTADIGTGTGQTQHASGMILAEYNGAVIKRVISVNVFRTASNFDYQFLGSNTISLNVGFSITNANNNVSTLRIKDAATAAGGQLAIGDRVVVLVELGNS